MPQRTTRGSTSAPSVASDISTAVDGFRKMDLGSSSRKQNTISAIKEEGWTTVQHSKPANASTKGVSPRMGSKNAPSNTTALSPPKELGPRPGPPSAAATSRVSAYNSGNWRDQPRPAYGPGQPNARGNGSLRSKFEVFPSTFYRPGIIITSPLHEQDYNEANSTVTADNRSITPSEFGNIHTKYRKMIVVACYSKHYVAVPLYTHNGRGLINKADGEYISIQDHRDTSMNFQALSRHGSLLTGHLQEGIKKYDPLTTAHFTYPSSKHYDCKVVYEGCLKPRSTDLLVRLFNETARKFQRQNK